MECFITPGPSDIGFDYSYIMAATGDRVPCVWVENQRIVNLDPNDPIEVSYEKPFPGEPLGKDHPELLTKLKPSPNHGHDMAIVNGISRIGYMKGGKQALWEDETLQTASLAKLSDLLKATKMNRFSCMSEPTTRTFPVGRIPVLSARAAWASWRRFVAIRLDCRRNNGRTRKKPVLPKTP